MGFIYNIKDGIFKDYSKEDFLNWIRDYFDSILNKVIFNGNIIYFYGSSRGYYKVNNRLSALKLKHFKYGEYVLFEEMLSKVKIGQDKTRAGGLFFTLGDTKLQRNIYFRAKKKLIELEVIYQTPFKDYYILNPDYVIKVKVDNKYKARMSNNNV